MVNAMFFHIQVCIKNLGLELKIEVKKFLLKLLCSRFPDFLNNKTCAPFLLLDKLAKNKNMRPCEAPKNG